MLGRKTYPVGTQFYENPLTRDSSRNTWSNAKGERYHWVITKEDGRGRSMLLMPIPLGEDKWLRTKQKARLMAQLWPKCQIKFGWASTRHLNVRWRPGGILYKSRKQRPFPQIITELERYLILNWEETYSESTEYIWTFSQTVRNLVTTVFKILSSFHCKIYQNLLGMGLRDFQGVFFHYFDLPEKYYLNGKHSLILSRIKRHW